MYLLYLDDSGSANNRNEAYLVLGGFCVFERQLHYISQALDGLASKYHPSNPNNLEFHASEMFSGNRPPWNGMHKGARRDTIKDVLGVLANSFSTTSAFACAVHKESFPGRDPMEIAFADLCSRFDMLLGRYFRSGDPQRGLIVLDESAYETSLQRLAKGFRDSGTPWGTQIKNIVEVPLFVDSSASRAVQLADHVAYSVFRRYESGDATYLDVIDSRFDEDGGVVHGISHKQTNNPNCRCLACASRVLSKKTTD